MRNIRQQGTVLLAAAAAFFSVGAVCAGEIQVEQAERPVFFHFPGPLWPDVNAAVDDRLEPSAVAPIADGRLLLVADDKTNALVVVDARTGTRIGDPLPSAAFPRAEAKWEAMALDDRGDYYLIGSHSGRNGDERAAHSWLLRFRLKSGPARAPVSIDEGSVTRYDVTTALANAGLYSRSGPARNRVKIEGLTIRTLRDKRNTVLRRELVIGLREPDDPITAYAADITQPPAPGTPLVLRKLFTFTAGMREGVRSQLSSLEYVPGWNGFLVTTSSEDENNAYHGNTLWFLPDADVSSDRPVRAQKVWLFGVGVKAEGLCLLPPEEPASGDMLRFALVYDNDPARTKKPSRLQLLTLARWPEPSLPAPGNVPAPKMVQ